MQKYSKVEIGSWKRFMKPGIGIIHGFFIKTHHLLPSRPPNLAKNGHFEGYSGPNHMCAWLQTAEESFQSQNWFTTKDYSAWDGNHRRHFKLTTIFSAKLTPSLGQKRAAPWLILPKSHVCMVVDCCRSTSKSKLVHKKRLQSMGWESCMFFIQTHHLLPS